MAAISPLVPIDTTSDGSEPTATGPTDYAALPLLLTVDEVAALLRGAATNPAHVGRRGPAGDGPGSRGALTPTEAIVMTPKSQFQLAAGSEAPFLRRRRDRRPHSVTDVNGHGPTARAWSR